MGCEESRGVRRRRPRRLQPEQPQRCQQRFKCGDILIVILFLRLWYDIIRSAMQSISYDPLVIFRE
jgi:hypothetical protein